MMREKTFNQIFYLRKSKSKTSNLGNIYLRITLGGVRTEISLQRQCVSDNWNSQSGSVVGRNEISQSCNSYLNSVRLRIYEIYKDLMASGKQFSGEDIKAKFLGISKETPKMLIEIYDQHNKQFKELVGREFSTGTYKRFEVCKKSLSEFIKWKYQLEDINIDKVNYEFISDYEFYIKSKKNCSHNTAMGYLKKLKKIVRQCVAKEWLLKDPFATLKITLQDTHRTILMENELAILSSKVLKVQRLDQVRDIFLFSCYTGLSYSDVSKLSSAEISIGVDGQKWVMTNRTKTDTATRLPLLSIPLEIIDKYSRHPSVLSSGRLLPTISNQKLNSYLKELADMCGIHKELTFHCARHTFATTVTLSNGVPIETVSKMLGHKSIRTTQQYAKVLDDKVSRDMMSLGAKLEVLKQAAD